MATLKAEMEISNLTEAKDRNGVYTVQMKVSLTNGSVYNFQQNVRPLALWTKADIKNQAVHQLADELGLVFETVRDYPEEVDIEGSLLPH